MTSDMCCQCVSCLDDETLCILIYCVKYYLGLHEFQLTNALMLNVWQILIELPNYQHFWSYITSLWKFDLWHS